MDPTACYKRMVDAMHDKDLIEAREAAMDLERWLRCGGFYPIGIDSWMVDAVMYYIIRTTCV